MAIKEPIIIDNYKALDIFERTSLYSLIGGKSYNLFQLQKLGTATPYFFCITTKAYHIWRDAGYPETLPESLLSDILRAFDQNFSTTESVAIRSSAIDEDGQHKSFAGQYSTYLNVKREHLGDKIIQCFQSIDTDNINQYREFSNDERLNAIDSSPIALAIVVQKLIHPQCSGVLFTANPVTGSHDELVATGAYGLGEGVVSESVPTDTATLNKANLNVLDQHIADKTHHIIATKGSTQKEDVPKDLRKKPVLSSEQYAQLARLCLGIEKHYGYPQDIEWAYHDSVFYILQTRPITTLPNGIRTVFDNSNIVEGYPGITTPLTFSFARSGYEIAFSQAAERLGVSRQSIRENSDSLSSMIGFLKGRLYYNITSWYRFYAMIPGLESNIPNWESALGLTPSNKTKNRNELQHTAAKSDHWIHLIKKVRVKCLLALAFISHSHRCRRFHQRVAKAISHFNEQPLNTMNADEVIILFHNTLKNTLFHWEVTLLNDLITFSFSALVEKLCKTWGISDAHPHIVADLLADQDNMESVMPVLSISSLTETVRTNTELLSLFTHTSDTKTIWEALTTEPKHRIFLDSVNEHIQRYGDRVIEELKLERLTAHEDPTFIIKQIKQFVAQGKKTQDLVENRRSRRIQAESIIKKSLHAHFFRRIILTLTLRHARKFIAERENMRFARTRAFGMARKMFRQIGKCFVRDNILINKEDIFFLTQDEIFGFIRGTSVSHDLKSIVLTRQEEHQGFRKINPLPRIHVYGPVSQYNLPCIYTERHTDKAAEPLNTSTLRGTGCSPGTVIGRARIVTNPEDAGDLEGRILIANSTDPGWVFLMIAAGGIVVERGNVLSHTAIIGRELGIPTVIGVSDATTLIKEDDLIEINGSTGEVVIKSKDGDHNSQDENSTCVDQEHSSDMKEDAYSS